jgi:hypothetical protein
MSIDTDDVYLNLLDALTGMSAFIALCHHTPQPVVDVLISKSLNVIILLARIAHPNSALVAYTSSFSLWRDLKTFL